MSCVDFSVICFISGMSWKVWREPSGNRQLSHGKTHFSRLARHGTHIHISVRAHNHSSLCCHNLALTWVFLLWNHITRAVGRNSNQRTWTRCVSHHMWLIFSTCHPKAVCRVIKSLLLHRLVHFWHFYWEESIIRTGNVQEPFRWNGNCKCCKPDLNLHWSHEHHNHVSFISAGV